MGLLTQGQEQGSALPHRHRRLAGKIRPADGRWSWEQRLRSKPRRWGLRWGLGGDGRLTKEADSDEVLEQWVSAGERSEEQSRVPARGSREFTASVQSSGWCRRGWRGTRTAVRGGPTMASAAAKGAEEEEGSLHGGCSFYSWRRRLAKVVSAAAEAVASATVWTRSARAGTVVRTGRLTSGPQRFYMFFNLSKTSSTLKIKIDTLTCSKNS
jgi:hypothetical protein